jgi:molecular chaperone DnaK (HSP70)
MSSNLLKETMNMVDKLLLKNKTRIDYIVLVGGSSNMPQIKRAFTKAYPDIPLKLYEPERAIAFGCAIYAEHFEENNYLRDICKFSYGCRLIENFRKYRDTNRLIIVNLIIKGQQLPASKSISGIKVSSSSETKYEIYESEISDKTYNPKDGVHIGEVVVSGVPNGQEGDKSETTIEVDKSGLLKATTVDLKSGKSSTTRIHLKNFF